ncbi:FkbM family methyltransferase [Nitratireductor sp. XY-223]|uniref:FkbM family methyltransferase n=1 Tax=Nitratireductor sp. XY-223 TaxID=2561926 RepID=UPI0010AA5403|nr:FkbM family methyltransferase [Nitratireductor sp. XY-223]
MDGAIRALSDLFGRTAFDGAKMKLDDLERRNEQARAQVAAFRRSAHPDRFGEIDAEFHKYKNGYPFYGHVPVIVGDIEIVMYCGNDDLVALTYFWHGANSYEAGSLDIWLRLAKNAQNVLDVGAFSGLYSLVAASACPDACIWAFEPSRRTHGRLLLNAYINGYQKRIRAINNAVSNEVSELRLMQFRGENILGNGAAIVEKQLPVTDVTEVVGVIPLDDFCVSEGVRPDLLKIDVEGAEVMALEGMAEMLATDQPTMLVEVTPQTAKDVKAFLDRLGYKTCIVDDRTGVISPYEGPISAVSNLYAER